MEKKFGVNAKAELESNGVFSTMLELGREYKYNHRTCPSGEDKRRRLYVTNKGGAILYKCFNCGGSGHYREKDSWSPIKDPVVGRVDNTKHPDRTLLDDRTLLEGTPISDEALLWLLNYEIDPDEFPNTFYGSHDGSLCMSVMNNTTYAGYQRRYFHDRHYKYVTQTTSHYHYLIGKVHPDVVFVVEDLLSSYKIWSLGYSVVALLGTSLKGEWPTDLLGATRVVVWLDNDVAGHAGAVKFVKEMSALFPRNLSTVFDRQPKEVPYSELSSICEAFV